MLAALLECVSLILLLVALAKTWQLGRPRQTRLLAILLGACLLLACALFLNVGSLLQETSGVNLHMPATLRTRARLWLKEHTAPQRSQIGSNIRLLADAVTFYRSNKEGFSPEAQLRMEQCCGLPSKPDHILSIAEEGRYYEAAQQAWMQIEQLAGDPPQDKPPAGQ
jgi:hypothetical protein